jgi:hypothetical protein
MTDIPEDEILLARMHAAYQRVETSLPFQMSAAIKELEAARLNMRAAIQLFSRSRAAEESAG